LDDVILDMFINLHTGLDAVIHTSYHTILQKENYKCTQSNSTGNLVQEDTSSCVHPHDTFVQGSCSRKSSILDFVPAPLWVLNK